MKIFLIGFMGAGKEKVGRALADLMHCPFYDLRVLVESQTGKPFPHLLTADANDATFRTRETEALHSLPEGEAVVATATNTPCCENNMEWMNAQGLTVFLDAAPALLSKRLWAQRHHYPILRDLADPQALEAFVEKELTERRSCYEQAHLTVRILHDDMPVARHLFIYLGPYRNWEE